MHVSLIHIELNDDLFLGKAQPEYQSLASYSRREGLSMQLYLSVYHIITYLAGGRSEGGSRSHKKSRDNSGELHRVSIPVEKNI